MFQYFDERHLIYFEQNTFKSVSGWILWEADGKRESVCTEFKCVKQKW